MKTDRRWQPDEELLLVIRYKGYGDAERLRPLLQMRSAATIIKKANSIGLKTRRGAGLPYSLEELKGNCDFPPSGCWVWRGDKRPKGYGVVIHAGIRIAAHRLAYALAHPGKDIDSYLVLHHCDNPPCINPDHLYAGTYKDNNTDTVKRGRYKNQYGPIKANRADI